MNGVTTAVRLARAVQNAWKQRWLFLLAFLGVFFVSFSLLTAFDFVPDPTATSTPSAALTASPLVALNAAPLSPNVIDAFARAEQPVKIEIPKTKLVAPIANPTTTNVNALDALLLNGAVRYPSSAELGVNGNVIIFGHSAEYYPVVNNRWYKTFDGIEKLAPGDTIIVYSSDKAYVYSVDTVGKKDASSDSIPLQVAGQKLTLSTCDTFGKKTDRTVVTATLVESHPLGA